MKIGHKWRSKGAVAVAAAAMVFAAAPAANAADGHEGGHEGGGDACTFFLEHMWANEDGIPLLGSPAHLNDYHTDPVYDNLVLSLASGAIGNSEMPVIDVYGGPLGWIPVFNPSHVKGHGTDYVTLLTSCGGIGIPLDSNDLTNLDVPSVEELADLSDLILPGLPTPEMLTDPTYLWKTTDASAILERVTPETLLDMEEYIGFAGDHFDTWRLLWETVLSDVSSGNPTGVLDVLQITDNINTLESLSGALGGDIASDLLSEDVLADLLGGNPASGLLGEGGVTGLLGEDAIVGLLGDDAVTGVLGEDAIAGLLGDLPSGLGDGGLPGGLLGEGGLPGGLLGDGGLPGGLLGDGGLPGGLGGLLGGGDDGENGGGDDGASDVTKFSVLLSGSVEPSAAAQCQGSLNGNVFAITCVYTGMSSDVTSVTLNTGAGDLQLAGELELKSTGGTSGGAVGSFELTAEQISALNSAKGSVTITTTTAAGGEISGAVVPCD